jgi:hypothetical protein
MDDETKCDEVLRRRCTDTSAYVDRTLDTWCTHCGFTDRRPGTPIDFTQDDPPEHVVVIDPQPVDLAAPAVIRFRAACRRLEVPMGSTAKYIYGESNPVTLCRIWDAINTFAHPTAADVLLDWGMGTGKTLVSCRHLSVITRVVGCEADPAIFAVAQRNMKDDLLSTLYHAHAQRIPRATWQHHGVSIVVVYDGMPARKGEWVDHHVEIMVNLLLIPTVRVIVSTHTNQVAFDYYRECAGVDSVWDTYQLNGLAYQKQTCTTYCYVKR